VTLLLDELPEAADTHTQAETPRGALAREEEEKRL
jgi:hypothetical protein